MGHPHKKVPEKIPESAVSVRLPKMCEILGISQTKAKELIRTGKVRSVKLGQTRLISLDSIHELMSGEVALSTDQKPEMKSSETACLSGISGGQIGDALEALRFVEQTLETLRGVEVSELVKACHLVALAKIRGVLSQHEG